MKKTLIYLIIALLAFTTSCHDKLNLEPTDKVIEEKVWVNKEAMELYVAGFYALLRDNAEITGSLSDGYSDIVKYTSDIKTNHNRLLLQKDIITSESNALSAWGNYDRIRRHNEFLYLAPKKNKILTDEELRETMAEVKFLRAYAYYKMIRVHGGVVIRDDRNGPDRPAQMHKIRSTEAESWDFVINDLLDIAEKLPEEWSAQWTGRITKGAAYALLTRCALYAKRYDVVIYAYKALEKMDRYALQKEYATIFSNNTTSNKEVILGVYFKKPNYTHSFDRNYVPKGDMSPEGSRAVPTSELVDDYEFSDGTIFNWSLHDADPYTNREPRFYASILYQGAEWKNRTIATESGGVDAWTNFQTGNESPRTTVTGYYIKKYLQESNIAFDNEKSDQFWSELRLGEVILNYAEALAESNFAANSVAAHAALNKIRGRVGLPARNASNIDDFRTLLRKERKVELAFEGHRYWDLRRWRIAHQVIDGQRVHGVKVTVGANTSYERVECDAGLDRYFPEKYYLLPIPKGELDNNKLCDQNPFW